jgi:hypothetical protein
MSKRDRLAINGRVRGPGVGLQLEEKVVAAEAARTPLRAGSLGVWSR